MMSDHVAKRAKMDGKSGNGTKRKSTLPKQTCDLSTGLFSEILKFAAFVDKTLFIKAFLEADVDIIVTLAPRRFGKSTNMNMVQEFLSGNKKLFEDSKLKICEEEKNFFIENCKEYPIIYVNLKDVSGWTEDEVLPSMKTVIRYAYNNHHYLVKKVGENYSWSDEKLKDMCLAAEKFVKYWREPKNVSRDEVVVGLKFLSQCLYVYHRKHVYVLIDEYDTPILNAITRENPKNGVVDTTINLISDVMSNFFMGNKYVKKGLINACVRIAEMLPEDANIKYYEFLREPKFSPYFGFTNREVEDLFEKDEFVTLRNDEIQKWYSGYKLMHTNEYVIYSNSILRYLANSIRTNKPDFDSYWSDSENIVCMTKLFAKAKIQQLIKDLINDEEINIKISEKMSKDEIFSLKSLIHQQAVVPSDAQADLFLQFLSQNGYLNVIEYTTGPSRCTLRIPNQEIKLQFKRKLYSAQLLGSFI